MAKYTLSNVLWWIQKAASKNAYISFEVEGYRYDPLTGWDFGTIDPKNFKIEGNKITTPGHSIGIRLEDIHNLSLCKLEPYKDGCNKIIPIKIR